MLIVFVQHMEMILWGQIDPTQFYEVKLVVVVLSSFQLGKAPWTDDTVGTVSQLLPHPRNVFNLG